MKRKLKPTDVPASLKNIDINQILRKRGIFTQQRMNQEMKLAAIPLARELLKKKGKVKEEVITPRRHAQFTDEQVLAYWEKQIKLVEMVEARFEKQVEQYIVHVEKDFLATLDSVIADKKKALKFLKKDYFTDNEAELLVKAQFDFAPLLENAAVLAGQEANKLIGINDPYLPFNYRDQIARNVKKFTESMLDTDRKELNDLISNGLQAGRSVPEIRSSIVDKFDQFSKTQAQRITRTEVLRASNQASVDAYEQSGVVEGKQWLTAGAVDECAQYDGDIVTLSGSFYGSDNEFQDGDPPLHPNCKCVVLPVVVGTRAYVPDNKSLYDRVEELEGMVDKRTKAFKELKAEYRDSKADDQAYIKALEKHLNIKDAPVVEE